MPETHEPSETSAAVPLPPRQRDSTVIAEMPGVAGIYINPSHWWQNASFALPALITVLSLIGGQLFGSGEATGFGLFALAVTAIMTPVVLLTWRGTATSIVLTRAGATALHEGRVLHEAPWNALRRIERVEYLGNVRFKLVHGEDDRFLTVESEIEGSAALVEQACALSGIPRQSGAATS